MKKRLISFVLALALCFSPTALAVDGVLDSGASHLPKLSKAEIAQLLEENSLDLPEQIFDEQPSVSAPYATGKVKEEALQAATDRLNAWRSIAGLTPVELDAALSENAQYGAVIQGVHNSLSHTPSRPTDMNDSFYQQAYEASSSSNLAAGYTLTEAIDGFMEDTDSSNIDRVGHRRWQLNPQLGKIGFGAATAGEGGYPYVAEKVFDRSAASYDYDFVAWPASGNFPADTNAFGANTAWSVSLNPQKFATPRQSDLTVTLTQESSGQSWVFQGNGNYTSSNSGMYFNVDTGGYGVSNCIIFRPDGITDYEGLYTVSIDGLKSATGAAVDFSYQVDFFNAKAYADAPADVVAPFVDVKTNAYYAEAVEWAVKGSITSGTSDTTFSPDATCTTAQILTFLWRSQGQPAPTIANPFTDIQESDYYYQAALWAHEKGLVSGSAFGGNAPATRAATVTYLWKLAGSPEMSLSNFSDVAATADYAQAVAWAVEQGITTGTSDTAFSPAAICTRGQIMTFLYRAFA